MPDLENPFTAEQKKEVLDGITLADQIIAAANKAISAGIDIGDNLEQAKATRERFLKIKNTYFPNG